MVFGSVDGQTCVDLNIGEDGTVNLNVGTVDVGGARSSMAMIAAEELGISYGDVKTHIGDTASLGHNDTGQSAPPPVWRCFCRPRRYRIAQRTSGQNVGHSGRGLWQDGEAVAIGQMHDNLLTLSLKEIAAKAGHWRTNR